MARALVGSLASFFLLAGTAQADSAGLGKVHFANSCSAAVQEKLQRAVAMLHSFYYAAATRAFQDIAAEDNGCAIAAWGYASILMSNPLAGTGASPKDAASAQKDIERVAAIGEQLKDCLLYTSPSPRD